MLRDQQGSRAAPPDTNPRGETDFVPLHDGPALLALAPVALGEPAARPGILVTIAWLSSDRVAGLEQSAGLRDLSFGAEPVPGRQVRSVLDRKGRIVGWFSWTAERPLTSGMHRLSPLIAVVVFCLLAFSGLALWHLHRTTRQLGQSEAWARQLAHEDLLTGVGSQRHLHARLDHALAARGMGETVVLAHVDIDGFKDVNDLIGPRGGDQLLVEFADRLRKAFPGGAFVARLGGDEFAALLTTPEPIAAEHAVEGALASVMAPYWLDQSVAIRVSAGMAQAPSDGDSRDEVMRRAELALRAAKRAGGGQAKSFAPAMESELQDRAMVKRDLTRAIADHALDLHYQPIVTADGARIIGVEALLRWSHPTRGEVLPSLFVEVAEETGQMGRLGALVLRRALADAARWPGLFVCVNLSPVQVNDPALVNQVARFLAETRTTPSRLVLEITEGVLMRDPEQAKARLEALRALGVRIALDDFGAGYSSLSYLQKFPFDKLKIDRGFVTGLGKAGNGGVIIQAIVSLGRALGVSVLVEGVETEEQRVLLRLAGCDEMQGFLFSRPVPADAIGPLLTRSARTGDRRAIA